MVGHVTSDLLKIAINMAFKIHHRNVEVGIKQNDLVTARVTVVTPVLEYACPV